MKDTTIYVAIISGAITLIVGILGIFGNMYLTSHNRKMELLLKTKEMEHKEYQFLLENLKGFWEYQNKLYAETMKVASVLVLNDDTRSEEFLGAYKRFWELYWSELPVCESREIESAMVGIKDLIYKKKKLDPEDASDSEALKPALKSALLNLAKAVRDSSLLLKYSENIKSKIEMMA